MNGHLFYRSIWIKAIRCMADSSNQQQYNETSRCEIQVITIWITQNNEMENIYLILW